MPRPLPFPEQFNCPTRFVEGGTSPFVDIPLPPGVVLPPLEVLTRHQFTAGYGCPPTIDASPAMEYRFAYWTVRGGKVDPLWGYDYQAAPKAEVEDTAVFTLAVYYLGGKGGGQGIGGGSAVQVYAVDYATGTKVVSNTVNVFNVLTDPAQNGAANTSGVVNNQLADQQIEASAHVDSYSFVDWQVLGPNAPFAGAILNATKGQTFTALAHYTTEREELRFVRGTVDHNGNRFVGKGFKVKRILKGLYRVTFTFPFAEPPSGSATQIFNGRSPSHQEFNLTATDGTGGDPRDNAVIVWATKEAMLVLIGDSGGDAADRPFSFIVAGPPGPI